MKKSGFAHASLRARTTTALAALVLTTICHGQLAQTAWPKYHGDGKNTGSSSARGAMPVLKWRAASGSSIQGSLSLGKNGKLYGSVLDLLLVTNLISIDANTGATTTLVPLIGDALSTPTMGMDGNLYCHTGLGLYSVSPATGNVHYLNVGLSFSQSSPAFGADGTLYVGNLLSLYAVNAATGATKWSRLTLGTVSSSAAIGSDGTVYIGSGNNLLYALRPSDGSVKWTYSTHGYLAGSPTIDTAGNVFIASEDGHLYKLNGATGALIWSQAFNQRLYSTPALGAHNELYLTGESGIYGVNATTGAVVWSKAPHGGYYGSAVVDSNNTVYAVDNSAGYVSALQGSDGRLLWSYPVGTNSAAGAPIIGDDGSLYVAAAGGAAAAYGFDTFANAMFDLDSSGINGGNQTVGTVTLPGKAVADMTIALASQNPAYLTVPSTVTIPAGSSSATFPIKSKAYYNNYTVNVKATYDGVTKTKLITIFNDHVASVSLNPTMVIGGSASTATVQLASSAPAGGYTVKIASSNPAFVTTPNAVTIPAGANSATFNVTTKPYTSTYTANIKVMDSLTTRSATLTVQNNSVASVVLSPNSVTGGADTTGTVKLRSKAAVGGFTVNLATGNPSFVGVPGSVTIPEGATQASFTVTTKKFYKTYSTSVKASDGKYTAGAMLTVTP